MVGREVGRNGVMTKDGRFTLNIEKGSYVRTSINVDKYVGGARNGYTKYHH